MRSKNSVIEWAVTILFLLGAATANGQYTFKGKISGAIKQNDTLVVRLKNDKHSFSRKVILPHNRFYFTNIPHGHYIVSVLQKETPHIIGSFNIDKNIEQNITLQHTDSLKDVEVQASESGSRPKNDDLISYNMITNAKSRVSKHQIEMSGAQRLDDVLKEQPGIAVVSDLGAGNRAVGIQMQGFSSEYIKILLDGMPIEGRMNGNLDLSRFDVQNIDHIEITKGATSTLYGADALGGVINIITNQNISSRQLSAGINYGSFNTLNANTSFANPFGKRKSFYQINEDFYKTDGFNANPQYLLGGQTTPPYISNTLQGRMLLDISDKDRINISTRYSFRNSSMWRNYGDNYVTTDKLNDNDVNVLASWNHNFSNRSRFLLRYYLTHYYSGEEVALQNSNSALQTFRFGEWTNQLEAQYLAHSADDKWQSVSGAGIELNQLNGYENEQSGRQYDYFGYSQVQYMPAERLKLSVGARATGNSIYGGKITPAAGIEWKPLAQLTIRPSFGMGFKSPTYTQMNQVFTNLTQGYTVIGANVLSSSLAALDSAGQVSSIWPIASSIKNLKAETSHSYNIDAKWTAGNKLSFEANIFYNHIKNMIFTEQIGIKTNGAQIFSYINLARVVNKGLEINGSCKLFKGIHFAANYQLLYSQDLSVLDSIKAGKLTVRANPVRTAYVSDYFNLPVRSRNMLQLQLYYDDNHSRWGGSFRANYRGKYGFLDLDNNGFIDPYDIYVNGFWLLNASVQYTFLRNRNLRVQFSINNINNAINYLIPYQSGRSYKIGIHYNLSFK
ncbi:hypothetical protein A9P82_09460 [Arachidicoccus ginsenosidimutans]|uniref:TonB-dependent receptor plug domain-containing protein n=1 Tax=Arachidicoccus sp. BS20 TaxID=1850526 RepID=UPI0007F140CF|nr:TonB-dependent receptor [Arachidicoccus sp. BS20]ANI89495.1 hypothetical protein A9P82_09460 [Arachidicoccus sp. BS20]